MQGKHAWFKSSYSLSQQSRAQKHAVKGVVFDMGGVILPSPFPIIDKAEKDLKMPLGTIHELVLKKYRDDNGGYTLWA